MIDAKQTTSCRGTRLTIVPQMMLAVAVAGLLIGGLERSWWSDAIALAASVPDDSYYALIPAWNAARVGIPTTFDGSHLAYGFQPLWEIVLAVVAALSGSKLLFLRAALSLNYLLLAVTGWLVGDFVRRLSSEDGESWGTALGGIVAGGLLLVNRQLVTIATAGKETALYLLLLVCALRLIFISVSAERRGRRALWAGFLLSLLPLARLTPASVFIATLGLWWSWPQCKGRWPWLWWAAAPTLWFCYAWFTFGHLMPTSGNVKIAGFASAASTGQLWRDAPVIIRSVGPYLLELIFFTVGWPSRFSSQGASIGVLLLPLAGLLAVVGSPFGRPRIGRLALLLWVSIAGATIVPVVMHYRFDEVYYFGAWYHTELPLLVAVLVGRGVSSCPRSMAAPIALVAGVAVAASAVMGRHSALGPFDDADPGNLQRVIAKTAIYLNQEPGLGHGARLAAWNAGLLGFLADGSVVNLDGLANEDVVMFLQTGGSVGAYLKRERIELLVDARSANAPLALDGQPLTVVHVTPWHGAPGYEPGWFVLRVVPSGDR
jgi:hypothetical protein